MRRPWVDISSIPRISPRVLSCITVCGPIIPSDSVEVAVAGLSAFIARIDPRVVCSIDAGVIACVDPSVTAGFAVLVVLRIPRIDSGIIYRIHPGVGLAGPSRTTRNQRGPGQDQYQRYSYK
jgi:hypothetical protein